MDYTTDFFQLVLDNLSDGVYVVDTNHRIVSWNQASERLTGYSREEVLGRACSDNILNHVDESGKRLCLAGCPLSATMSDQELREANVFLLHRDGHRVPVSVRAAPMRNAQGEVIGAVEIFHNNTAYSSAIARIKELERLSFVDALTQIGNRRYAEMHLSLRLEEHRRYGWSFGVILFDVDHFKAVNDTHGHDLGDAVLRMVGTTLDRAARPFDIKSRWGGEEFLIIASNTDVVGLAALAERQRMLVSHGQLMASGGFIRATISGGATVCQAHDTPESILKRADNCLYEAKNAGRNRVVVYGLDPQGKKRLPLLEQP